MPLEEWVALFLVVVLILASIKFLKPFFEDKDDDVKSLPNFENVLVPKIQDLLKSKKNPDYAQFNYFLGSQAAVAGYNKIWDSEENLIIVGLKIEKPSSCDGKACLCFFKEHAILEGKPSKPCTKFDKVAYFLKDKDAELNGYGNPVSGSLFYSSILPSFFVDDEYKYLVLNGAVFNNKAKTIYIEKYMGPQGESIIYIAPVNDNTRGKISRRKAYIESINNQQESRTNLQEEKVTAQSISTSQYSKEDLMGRGRISSLLPDVQTNLTL